MSSIIRRRIVGEGGERTEIRRDAGTDQLRLFLPRDHDQVLQAIAGSAFAIDKKLSTVGSTFERRPHQNNVYDKIGQFLMRQYEALQRDPRHAVTWSRVILPPRTGKTGIMGEVIGTTGAAGLVLTPDLPLANRHRFNLGRQLPKARIGLLTGEERAPEPQGITIATYQTLVNMHKRGKIPPWMRHIPFVFPDEGHQGMTDLRIPMLRDVFDPACVRMAFTATPDYSDDVEDQLGTYFPELIEEMTVSEAFERDLLAKPISSIYEVDVDASTVTIRAGDYDEKKLGRLMAAAPVFQKGMDLRYAGENASAGALMTCSSVEQAEDLRDFLMAHRPAGTPEPIMIVGTTPAGAREAALNQFEAEPGHTLIVVGALLQGWDSERCKVLVDMAPSISWVRTKQKYFRPMTKNGDAKGRIYVLIPRGLGKTPLLPNDVFGKSVEQTYYAHAGGKTRAEEKPKEPRHRAERTPDDTAPVDIDSVVVKSRAIIEGAEVPTLVATRNNDVRTVIESGIAVVGYIPGQGEFADTVFRHPLFTGTGKQLLRYLGATKRDKYIALMHRLYPEAAANSLLNPGADIAGDDVFNSERDHAHMMDELHGGNRLTEGYADGYRALYGPDEAEPSPEEAIIKGEYIAWLREAIEGLDADVDHDLRILYEEKYLKDRDPREIMIAHNIPTSKQPALDLKLQRFVEAYIDTQSSTLRTKYSDAPKKETQKRPHKDPNRMTLGERWEDFLQYRKDHYPEIREHLVKDVMGRKQRTRAEAEAIWTERWEDSKEYRDIHDPERGALTRASFDGFYAATNRSTEVRMEKEIALSDAFTPEALAFWRLFLERRQAAYAGFRAAQVSWMRAHDPECTDAQILERYPDNWEDSFEYAYLTDPKNQKTFASSLNRLFLRD